MFYNPLRIALLLLFAWQITPTSQSQADELSNELSRIRSIVLRRENDPAAVAHLVQLTRHLTPAVTAELYLQIADAYIEQQNFDKAGELLHQLASQFPEEEQTLEGCRKLVHLYASSEVASTLDAKKIRLGKGDDLVTYARHSANQLRSKIPRLREDLPLLFQAAVAARRSGKSQLAVGFLTKLKHQARSQPWHERALMEEWLLSEREEEAPLTCRDCNRTSTRPQLDGELSDPCWTEQQSTEPVQFCNDDEFLYIAVRFAKQSGVSYPIDNRPRSHDAVLRDYDHVQISLDRDRDYVTAYDFSIDHRGWTAEKCWLAASWNPRWFVAAEQTEQHWTAEAAIPWSEIGGTPPAGDAWAVAINRILPSASIQEPEFEVLLFE